MDSINVIVRERLVALLGPNGAGKTTFVRIASALLKPTGGRMEVLGYDVVEKPKEVKKRIALLPQDASPDTSLTPLDLIATYLMVRGYDRSSSMRRAKEMLSIVDLGRYAKTLCAKLSGGMRKLVLISMVLAPEDVEAILLDEPSTGLDPLNAIKVWNLIKERVREGVNVLITSHILHRVEEHVPEVILLNKGRIVVKGNPKILVESLSRDIVRIDVSLPCREAVERIGIKDAVRKRMDVGGRCVLFVDKSRRDEILSKLSMFVELSVKKLDLEGVFLWYTH
ncbi:MAG: ABC transporter ATP-binding protein [Crenarchaeota archaeon]|nr:ABC transporter ATP-binding protein [Thermoproteota archaeon]